MPVAPSRDPGKEAEFVAEDGRHVARVNENRLQIIDRKTGKIGREWPIVRAANSPVWSRDSRFLAFAGFRCDHGDILGVLDIEKDLLFRVGGSQFTSPRWSPDGTELTVVVRRPNRAELWSFKTSAIAASQPLVPACACDVPLAAAELIGPWHCPRGSFVTIDLSRKYTALKRGVGEDNPLDLAAGNRLLAGVQFHIGDGIIQLAGPPTPQMPTAVNGISLHRQVVRLYVLHATQNGLKSQGVGEGELIAEYRVHYCDGELATIPVRIGQDVRDWWTLEDEPLEHSQVGWVGSNKGVARYHGYLRLYLSRWDNPHPEKSLQTIDYVATGSKSAPFCVAITAEGPQSLKGESRTSADKRSVSSNR